MHLPSDKFLPYKVLSHSSAESDTPAIALVS